MWKLRTTIAQCNTAVLYTVKQSSANNMLLPQFLVNAFILLRFLNLFVTQGPLFIVDINTGPPSTINWLINESSYSNLNMRDKPQH